MLGVYNLLSPYVWLPFSEIWDLCSEMGINTRALCRQVEGMEGQWLHPPWSRARLVCQEAGLAQAPPL